MPLHDDGDRAVFLLALSAYRSSCSRSQWASAMREFESIAEDFESAGLEGVDEASSPVEAVDFLLAAIGPARCQEVYGARLSGAAPGEWVYPLARLGDQSARHARSRCVNLTTLSEIDLNDWALASIVARQDPALPGFAIHRADGFALIQLFR